MGGRCQSVAGGTSAGSTGALLRHEEAGTTDSSECERAMMVFYARHVCRVDQLPEYDRRTFASIAENPEIYHTTNGHVAGTLKARSIIPRLGETRAPTLVTSGRHDEATPLIAGTVRDGIPGAEWVIFEESSHMAHAEEPERYMAVLDAFLSRVESEVASNP